MVAQPMQAGDSTPRPLRLPGERGRILDALARVAASDGYEATTVKLVADAAQIDEVAFARHFGSIEVCFVAAYELALEQVTERMYEATAGVSDPQEQLDRAVGSVLETIAAEPAFARLCTVETPAAGPAGLELRERTLREFAARLDQHRDRDEDGVPPLTSDLVVGGLYATVQAHARAGEVDKLPDLLPHVRSFWLVPLVGERGSEPPTTSSRNGAP
jgi:AcrR family transcriptional regulator